MSQENDASDPMDMALKSIRRTLLEIVQEGLAARPEGVHLTHVGAQFSKRMGASFETYIGSLVLKHELSVSSGQRKMVPFIEKFCTDIFNIDRVSEKVIRLTIRGNGDEPSADEALPLAPAISHEALPPRYRKGFWLAFVRPLPPGHRRCLVIDQVGVYFHDDTNVGVPVESEAGRYVVDPQYIVGIPPNMPIDAPRVHHAINGWLADTHAPLDRFVDPEPGITNRGPSVVDLLRIVDALSPEVAMRWLIPAEVLRQLRKS